MSERTGPELTLTVRGAEKRDAGRGIARLPESARDRLGVLSGDTLLIEGERVAAAKLWPARPGAEPGTVRVDADVRADAGARIGDSVRVRKATDLADADRVLLAPAADSPEADAESLVEAVRRDVRDRPVRAGQTLRIERLGTALVVAETDPAGTVRIADDTRVDVAVEDPDGTPPAADAGGATGTAGGGGSKGATDAPVRLEAGVVYEDIGGLDEELERVRETVELPLAEPELFARLGIDPPKGVLLHGPPGTGKTLIAKAVANEVDATFLSVSGPEITSKYKGESEERLREVFAEARREAPSVVFFDELDSIAAERDDGGDMESRVVGQLLSLMDGLDERGEVVVIGATNRVDAIDPALRRGGRFDREIEIGVPNEAGRREILDVHTRRMPLADDVDLDGLAARTHGFVGADLESLVTEAAVTTLRRARRGDDEPDPDALRVTREDVEAALATVGPSAMREHVAERPTRGFEAVGGLDGAKAALERAVTWPLRYGPLFEAADAEPPSGVLLYGPPGTGKTLLARAVAAESGVNFVEVAGPELLDRYVGESERAVREVVERARQAAPAVVFFDEIDAIAAERGGDGEVGDRVVSQLLTELDRAAGNPNLVVLAATNRRAALDPALLRPGRLESHVEVPAPDADARREILAVHAGDKPLTDDVDLDGLAARTGGYSGADLAALCREAATRAVRDVAERYEGTTANDHADEVAVRPAHFEAALSAVEPSLA